MASELSRRAFIGVASAAGFAAALGLSPSEAEADGQARGLQRPHGVVPSSNLSQYSSTSVHKKAQEWANQKNKIIVVYYGSDANEWDQTKHGVARAIDEDNQHVVAAVLQATGTGLIAAYIPGQEHPVGFNKGGGSTGISLTVAGIAVEQHNKNRPDRLAALEPVRN